LLTVRGAVSKAIEEARQAGLVRQSSEARVALATVSADGLGRLLAERADELPSLFLVADVALGGADGAPESPLVPGLRVRVERAPGEKCPRSSRSCAAHPKTSAGSWARSAPSWEAPSGTWSAGCATAR